MQIFTIKKIIAALLTLFGLIGGALAVNEYFTPRELTEYYIADLQQSQMQIQRNNEIARINQYLLFLNVQIDRLSAECISDPHDARKAGELMRLRNERDNAQRELRELLKPK